VSLTSEEMTALDAAFTPEQVSGERYPATLQAMIDR
jgi:hypothetical protein